MKDGISIVMAYHNRKSQLIKTLTSINKTNYDKNKLQIIIVNDSSNEEHSINDLIDIFIELDLFILNIGDEKDWINPCIPYNIGFNHIIYDKVIIQNPECYHQGDIILDVSQRLTNENYLPYACYSLNNKDSLIDNYNEIKLLEKRWFLDSYGRTGWYNHSKYLPSKLHFCSAISYKNLCKLNGFDERYKDGMGADDNEFLERIKRLKLNIIIVDSPHVFHQHHDSIYRSDTQETEENKLSIKKLFKDNEELYYNITGLEAHYKSYNNSYFNKGDYKLTILIPFKNREENLKVFIPYFHNFMKNNFSDIKYEIIIIEQGNDKLFNKGILFNIGFLLTSGNTDYYALHDVDQLPISSDYSYNNEPCHLCVNAIEQGTDGVLKNPYVKEKYQHKGGAITLSKELYLMANGHSNNYWGWGLIDDDFSFRLFDINHHLQRYGTRMNHGGLENNDKGYYITLSAKTNRFFDDDNYKRNYDYASKVVNKNIDWRLEGLNTTNFKVIDKIENEDYIKYIVDFEHSVEII